MHGSECCAGVNGANYWGKSGAAGPEGGADKIATLDRENREASKGSRFIVSVTSLGCFSVTNGDRIR
jgi:hypothetical protein